MFFIDLNRYFVKRNKTIYEKETQNAN